MKTLTELKGVKLLSKTQQKAITGGIGCNDNYPCPTGYCCVNSVCKKTCL